MGKEPHAAETLLERPQEGAAVPAREQGGVTQREGGAGGAGARLDLRETFRGYRVVRSLPSSGAESDIHILEKTSEQYVLKLYRRGIVPKMEILRKIAALGQDHPKHFVRIFETDFDEDSERWYEIQEFVPHGTLKELLEERKRHRLPPSRDLFDAVVREISQGLTVLHKNDILHLDLKPGNVLVRAADPLNVVLTDFGVSSLLDPELSRKFTASRGTPMYQSPESMTGNMGRASDWWGLGIMALEIAARVPMLGEIRVRIMETSTTVDTKCGR